MARRDARALRDEVADAIDRGKFKRAIECILELEHLEPRDAAWPKRAAEVYRRLGKSREAISAYERAVERYAQAGFLVQAIAVCKQILQIDPQHSATLRRLAEIAQERKTAPSGVASMRGVSDGVPELTYTRSTGPVPRVDPETLARVDMLDVAELDPDDAVPDLELAEETPPPRPAPPRRPTPPPIPPIPTSKLRARRSSPPPAGRHKRSSTNPVTLEPGEPLERVALGAVMPGAEAEMSDDGLSSGIIVIPLDDLDDVTGPIPIEMLPVEASDAFDVPLDAVAEADTGPDVDPEEVSLDAIPALSSSIDSDQLPAPRHLSAAARRALRATPLLSGLGFEQLEALIGRIQLVQLGPGEVLFREGDPGQTLYIVSEGEVGVFSEGPPRRELSRLLPGSFFGEVALITETPRSATIQAVGSTELLAIDRGVVRDLVHEHPDSLRVILRFIRNRLVERVIQTSPLFLQFPEIERRSLAERFDFLEIEEGTTLVRQGVRPEGLYLILAGRGDVIRELDGASRHLGGISTGEVFGEMALWSAEPSLFTVVARSKVLALRMPSATFREVIMTHPQVLAYVGDLAEERRRQVEAPQDSGDVIDMKLDLL